MTRKRGTAEICAGCEAFFDDIRPQAPIAQGLCTELKSDHNSHFLHPQHTACKYRKRRKR